MAQRLPVHVLTGFLGSGKTTLLNRLLAERALAGTAVLVNELGDVAIDHLLVEQTTDQIALLEGGCLCCTIADSLPETLLEICRKRAAGDIPAFDRVVIETTGLADPAPVMEVVRRSPLLAHFLEPGRIVTTFDALAGPEQLERHPEVMLQLVLADRIVITKADLAADAGAAARGAAGRVNPLAELTDAWLVATRPEHLLEPVPEGRAADGTATAPAHRHRHSHGVAAYGFTIDEAVTRPGLRAFSAALSLALGDRLLRCKGLLRVGTELVLAQGVRERFDFITAPGRASSGVGGLTVIAQHATRDEILPLLNWLRVPEGTEPPRTRDEMP